ncbi:MAG TPA: M20/M25/M40 family metallo-hydrolase [Pyrinomonadaceae bacterium]|nr:M20/M25/M40 family metallo-hydrolase [Pyrinomonadaceae bacterium]
MSYKKSLRTILAALVLFASQAAAQQSARRPGVVEAERLRRHVTYLASDNLEGRRTGTPGAQEAAAYVAAEFSRLGLLPPKYAHPIAPLKAVVGNAERGDVKTGKHFPEAYMQEFPYVAGVELGGGNALTATRRADLTGGSPLAVDFKVGEDWTPLGFSSNARVEGAAVFVGFGINDSAQNHDDYKGADVKDKVAVALSGTPDSDNPHATRFARSGELRFKAAAARAAGARALVVVAAEEKFADDGLTRLRSDNSGGDAGIPVAAVSRQAAWKILATGSIASLDEFEKKVRGLDGPYPQGPPPGDAEAARLSIIRPGAGVVITLTTDVVRKNAPAANVVGVLEGSDPKLKDEVIVIGAHYDHLGRGGEGSLATREGDVHYGADDNASGTAGLLELARLFSQERARTRRTVVFVAFGGEEEGLIGSSFYVQHPARPLERTVAMLNMDMIGRLREGALNVGGVGTSDVWREWVTRANSTLSLKVKAGSLPTQEGAPAAEKRDPSGGGAAPMQMDTSLTTVVTGADGRAVATATPAERFSLRLSEDGYGPSDHSSFYSKQVPVLFFFTGSHEDYHKPTDTADRINYDGEARVLEFVREIVYDLQDSEKRPSYAAAKSDAATRRTGFNVSLGTIPSYADSTDGLKLEGVREGSPAQAAGLAAEDVIVKLAGRDVRNVYDYTQALSEMKAGQEYEVELLRGGRRLTLKIVPAARR